MNNITKEIRCNKHRSKWTTLHTPVLVSWEIIIFNDVFLMTWRHLRFGKNASQLIVDYFLSVSFLSVITLLKIKSTLQEETFAILRFLAKLGKVYTREIFDLVVFAKLNSREKFQFWDLKSFLSPKSFKTVIFLGIKNKGFEMQTLIYILIMYFSNKFIQSHI